MTEYSGRMDPMVHKLLHTLHVTSSSWALILPLIAFSPIALKGQSDVSKYVATSIVLSKNGAPTAVFENLGPDSIVALHYSFVCSGQSLTGYFDWFLNMSDASQPPHALYKASVLSPNCSGGADAIILGGGGRLGDQEALAGLTRNRRFAQDELAKIANTLSSGAVVQEAIDTAFVRKALAVRVAQFEHPSNVEDQAEFIVRKIILGEVAKKLDSVDAAAATDAGLTTTGDMTSTLNVWSARLARAEGALQ